MNTRNNSRYGKKIREYAKVRMEQMENNTHVARDIIKKFELNKDLDTVRKWIAENRLSLKIQAKAQPIKRLFFDIETGYYTLKIKAFQLKNYIKYFNPDTIEKDKEIICISYKWQYDDKVHTVDFRKGEKQMLKKFIKVLGEADEIIGHNIDNFDVKELRARCIRYGVLMFPTYRTLDTLKKAKQYFRFASNKLDYIGKFLNVGKKLDHAGFELWEQCIDDRDDKAINEMIAYCENDVILTEDAYSVLSPYLYHNTNYAVLSGGKKWECPECAGNDVEFYKAYTTAMGVVRRNMKCRDCNTQYRVSNRTYLKMLYTKEI
jgi:DNA polymerase elongation subunit (family B)